MLLDASEEAFAATIKPVCDRVEGVGGFTDPESGTWISTITEGRGETLIGDGSGKMYRLGTLGAWHTAWAELWRTAIGEFEKTKTVNVSVNVSVNGLLGGTSAAQVGAEIQKILDAPREPSAEAKKFSERMKQFRAGTRY